MGNTLARLRKHITSRQAVIARRVLLAIVALALILFAATAIYTGLTGKRAPWKVDSTASAHWPGLHDDYCMTDTAPLTASMIDDEGADAHPFAVHYGVNKAAAVWSSNEPDFGGSHDGHLLDYEILVSRLLDVDTWSTPTLVNINGADTGEVANDGSPQIHVIDDQAVVVWSSFVPGAEVEGEPAPYADPDIYVALTTDTVDFTGWGEPQKLNHNWETDSGADYQPQLAYDPDLGRYVVAWVSSEPWINGQYIGKDYDILVSYTDDPTTTTNWSDPMPLNSNAAGDSGNDMNLKLVYAGGDTFIAAWDSDDTRCGQQGKDYGKDTDIFYSFSTDAGETWSPVAVLNSDAEADNDSAINDGGVALACNLDAVGECFAVWASKPLDYDADLRYSRLIDDVWEAPAFLNANHTDDTGDDIWPDARIVAPLITVSWSSNQDLLTLEDDTTTTVGTDWDILTAYSQDTGENWARPFPGNPNAEFDRGDDDRFKNFQVSQVESGMGLLMGGVWMSLDSLNRTIGNDYDILWTMAVSCEEWPTTPTPTPTPGGGQPGIKILNPPYGEYVSESTISLDGTVCIEGPYDNPTTVTVRRIFPTPTEIFETSFSGDCEFEAADVGLLEGYNVLEATVKDTVSDLTASDFIEVNCDTTSPTVKILIPENGDDFTEPVIGVFGIITDASPIRRITVNGENLDGEIHLPLIYALARLHEGENVITVEVEDFAGNVGSDTVTVDYSGLKIFIDSPLDEAEYNSSTSTITVSGWTTHRDVTVMVTSKQADADGTTSEIPADFNPNDTPVPTFSASGVPIGDGVTLITATASWFDDLTTSTVTVSHSISVIRLSCHEYGPLTLDATYSADITNMTQHLYTPPVGTDPIQRGLETTALDFDRDSWVYGNVLRELDDGTTESLKGVKVSVLNHSELGYTFTCLPEEEDPDLGARFELAVNGGGEICLVYERPGHIPVHRRITVPEAGYASAPDVYMRKLSLVESEGINLEEDGKVPEGGRLASGEAIDEVFYDEEETQHTYQRQPLVYFPPGVKIRALLDDGSTTWTHGSNAHLRVTEFTVGSNGPSAMPADLPATSAYTYCAELNIAEAENEAKSIVFFDDNGTTNVYFYVQNFLAFPVGTKVPVGSYDFEKASWIPDPEGIVLSILSVNEAGLAEIDIDGTAGAEDAEELAEIGITEAERKSVAGLYVDGPVSFWRAPMSHFSPKDLNWGSQPGKAHGAPPLDAPPCPNSTSGCIINIETQTMVENLSVAGAPFSLVYKTDRVANSVQSRLRIPLVFDAGTDLKRVTVEISVAGRFFTKIFEATPSDPTALANAAYTFSWDGLDSEGRKLQGIQPVTVRIGYTFNAEYFKPNGPEGSRAFAGSVAGEAQGGVLNKPRGASTTWRTYQAYVSSFDNKDAYGLGGWSPSIVHKYDPAEKTLYLGSGSERRVNLETRMLKTDLTGVSFPSNNFDCIAPASNGAYFLSNNKVFKLLDSGNTIEFATSGGAVTAPTEIAVGPDDAVYVRAFCSGGAAVFRLDQSRLAGSDIVNAERFSPIYPLGGSNPIPEQVEVGPDSRVYVLMRHSPLSQLLVYDPNGDEIDRYDLIYTDPSSNIEYNLGELGVAVGDDSTIYLLGNDSLFRIERDRTLTAMSHFPPVGAGDHGLDPDETYDANLIHLSEPNSIDFGKDGNIYILESIGSALIVHRVTPTGALTLVSRIRGASSNQDGTAFSATTTSSGKHGIAVSMNGRIRIANNGNDTIRSILPPEVPRGISSYSIPSQDGSELYIFDEFGRHQKTIDGHRGITLHEFEYDGSGYVNLVRDAWGNETQIVRSGGDTEIISPFGGRTTTLRADDNGYLDEVEYPDGSKYVIESWPSGLIKSFEDPEGNVRQYEYDLETGRLIAERSPLDGEGQGQTFNLVQATGIRADVEHTSSEGVEATYIHQTYRRTGGGSGFPVRSTHEQTVRRPAQESGSGVYEITTERSGAGRTRVSSTNGAKMESQARPDPKFGGLAPILDYSAAYQPSVPAPTGAAQNRAVITYQRREMTPAVGPTATPTDLTITDTFYWATATALPAATITSTASATPTPLPSQILMTIVRTINTDAEPANEWSTVETTSPLGRVAYSKFGPKGELIESQAGDRDADPLEATSYAYDDEGFLTSVVMGDSFTTYTYDENKHLSTVEDALGRVTEYDVDVMGRVTGATGPDEREVHMAYGANDNLTSLTMPGGQVHRFSYNGVDQTATYYPPAVAGDDMPTSYTYNRDRQLTRVEWPDGRMAANEYNVLGQHRFWRAGDGGLTTTRTLELTYDSTYRLTGIKKRTSPEAELEFADMDLFYDYAGDLMVSETTKTAGSSIQKGKISLGFDARLRVGRISAIGVTTDTPRHTYIDYDADGLLKATGASSTFAADETIEYAYETGEDLPAGFTEDFPGVALLRRTQLMDSVEHYDYTNRAQMKTQLATFEGSGGLNDVYRADHEYDLLGRITRTTETLMIADNANYTTATWPTGGLHYEYDDAGQLWKVYHVAPGGVETLAAEYEYDDNGNRASHWTPEFEREGEYDAQDRMTEYGGKTYEYNDAGQLTTKSEDGDSTTTYEYDMAGNLRKVVLPDETEVEYEIDGRNRRVGRLVDSVLTNRWLYGNQLEPVAELDANYELVSIYIYGSKPHVPDMIRSRRDETGVVGSTWIDYRVISDIRGSVRYVIREDGDPEDNGNIVQRVDYDEYGNALFEGVADADWQPFGFCGGIFDTVTGLIRFGARDYDPEVGRWVAKDPIGFAGTGLDLYLYCLNDPVNLIDPSGLMSLGQVGAAVGGFFHGAAQGMAAILDSLNGWGTTTFAEIGFYDPCDPWIREFTVPLGNFSYTLGLGAAMAGMAGKAMGGPSPSSNPGPNPGGNSGSPQTRFIGTESGQVFEVPQGATGPTPAWNGQGAQFAGGRGGSSLDSRVAGVRFMNPTARYPDGYASYSNQSGQTVNPQTGQTVAPSDPSWHIPLKR